MNALSLLDAAATGKVVVFGSLPPDNTDLDLLVRPADHAALQAALADAGFVNNGGKLWAHLPTKQAVELVPNRLPESLFDAAIPLDGCTNVCRPAPQHALLFLARRHARDGDRRQARIDAAVAEDPAAWDKAAADAPQWKAAAALDLLRRSKPATATERAAALAEEMGTAKAWRTIVGPLRSKGAVVSVSGVDGSGKTTQATELVASLNALGIDAVTVWTRLSFNERLWKIGRAGKRVLRVVARRKKPVPSTAPPADVDPSRLSDDVRRLRYESKLLTFTWSTMVAVENGLAHRRLARAHLRAGRVVVCDRYILDSAVHLRYRYGESRGYRFQRWVIKTLSPSTAAAFYLEVRPETAVARKQDQYDVGQLERQFRLYREECARLGVPILDGERPREDLSAEILAAAWRAIGK